MRLVVFSGVFVNSISSKRTDDLVDIFVVADNPKKGPVEKILKKMESEIGKELTYTLLSTAEFQYRQGMFDKFVQDIFGNEHDVIIDTLEAK